MKDKAVYFTNDHDPQKRGWWFIQPDCECNGVYLQNHDTGKEKCQAFKFDGNYKSPTFDPSAHPRCDQTVGGVRCHFFVKAGVAVHEADSRYPNEHRPLLDPNFEV